MKPEQQLANTRLLPQDYALYCAPTRAHRRAPQLPSGLETQPAEVETPSLPATQNSCPEPKWQRPGLTCPVAKWLPRGAAVCGQVVRARPLLLPPPSPTRQAASEAAAAATHTHTPRIRAGGPAGRQRTEPLLLPA